MRGDANERGIWGWGCGKRPFTYTQAWMGKSVTNGHEGVKRRGRGTDSHNWIGRHISCPAGCSQWVAGWSLSYILQQKLFIYNMERKRGSEKHAKIKNNLNCFCKPNPFVSVVKNGVPFGDEQVTQNPHILVQIHSRESTQAKVGTALNHQIQWQ